MTRESRERPSVRTGSASLPTLPVDRSAPPRSGLLGHVISHYRVDRKLGAGGMGEVYLAHDLALDRRVALKVLGPGFRASTRERLLREAWTSSRVQHPAIATFYEAGQVDGIDFIAMEYVEGRTLRDELRNGPLPVRRSLEIVGTVLEGLVHAHFWGILHRDIKPDNIMIAANGHARLLDFGLAKGLLAEEGGGGGADFAEPAMTNEELSDQTLAADATREMPSTEGLARLTQVGGVVGTPGYMPPEQLRGEQLDARADVFAVGVVLYEVLQGAPAFTGSTFRERRDSILHRDPAPLTGHDVPEELRTVVARALARDRSHRHPSAAAMLADLRRIGGGDARPTQAVRLAVRDFQDLRPQSDGDWIASAVSEALATKLGDLPRVTVAPREKVMKTVEQMTGGESASSEVELGLRLGCSAVLTGSVESDGTELRIAGKVTEVATGLVLADESLHGTRDGIFDLEDQLARSMAAGLGLEVAGSERPALQLHAYESYAKARRLVWSADRASFESARALLERAVELEPGYARALASLAHMLAWAYHSTGDAAQLRAANIFAERAIEADPLYGEAHCWKGYILLHQGRVADSIRHARQAMKLDPSSPLYAYFSEGLRSLGRSRREALEIVAALDGPADVDNPHQWLRQESVKLHQHILELNPVSCWSWLCLGWSHMELGAFDEALWCLERAVELEPKAVPPTAGVDGYVAECLRRSGDLPAARTRFLTAVETVERTNHMYRDLWRGLFLCGLGRTALQQGDEEAARAAFTQAILHLRSRHQARGGGHVLVQALAGLARASADAAPFDEALTLFRGREDYEFGLLWGCSDDIDLLELSRAAGAIGRDRLALELLNRAVEFGSSEAAASGSTPR